jgi:hypothetical protein
LNFLCILGATVFTLGGGDEKKKFTKCKIRRPTQKRKQQFTMLGELLLYKQGTAMQENVVFAQNASGTPPLIDRQANVSCQSTKTSNITFSVGNSARTGWP